MSEQEILVRKIIPYLRQLGFGAVQLEQPFGVGTRRIVADAVAFDQQDKPEVLIEYKGGLRSEKRGYDLYDPAIRQTYRAALIAETPYFLVTDGDTYLWFAVDWGGGTAEALDKPPAPKPLPSKELHLKPFFESEELDKILFSLADLFRSDDKTNAVKTVLLLLHTKLTDEQRLKLNKQSLFYALPNKDPVSTIERIQALDKQGTSIGLPDADLATDALVSAIGLLQPFSLLETDRSTLRKSFGRFISGYLNRELGQYVTPSTIVDFMVQIVAPAIGEKVIDPACGTGGFLISTLDSWIASDSQLAVDQSKKQVVGIDIDPLIAQIAWLNIRLFDNVRRHIYIANSLDQAQLNRIGIKRGTYDVVISNPPIGGRIMEQDILIQYQIRSRATNSSEALFLEQSLHLLREGGRLALIVPEGVLFTARNQPVRSWLLEHAAIDAIVSLPTQALLPLTGIKTSIIFATKGAEQKAIFMTEAKNIGYDERGRSAEKNDLNGIVEDYQAYRQGETMLKHAWVTHPTEEFANRMDVAFLDPKNNEWKKFLDNLTIPVLRLEEVADIKRGKLPRSTPRADSGFPIIGTTQIRGNVLDLKDALYVSENMISESDLHIVNEGDLFLSTIRSRNAPAIAEKSNPSVTLDQTLILVHPEESVLLSRFLQFLFTTPLIQMQLDQLATGATIQRVYPRQLAEIRVPVPSLETQKAIVTQIDQIESLRRTADKFETDLRTNLIKLLENAGNDY